MEWQLGAFECDAHQHVDVEFDVCPEQLCCPFSLKAIEDGSLDTLDNSDLINTDIPLEIPLPEEPFMNVSICQCDGVYFIPYNFYPLR